MEIIWRQAAVNDLAAIHDYIARDNPAAAVEVRTGVLTATQRLADYSSFLGRDGRVDGTREPVLTDLPYIIVFRVRDEQIRILAVIHTSRLWPKRF